MLPNRTLVLFLIILYIQGLEGRGELTIRLVSFDNDYGLTYDGGCCDNWQARGWGCMQKCDYVMRVVISGLSRANDHVFLFHRPLMYNKNNIIFDDCPWATELSIPFDTWPGQVELSAYFYDYDDNDDTTLLVDWFDTRLRQETISTDFQHMAVIGSRRDYKTRLTFDWAVHCAGLSNCIRDDVKQFLDRLDHPHFKPQAPVASAAASSGEDPPKSMSTKHTPDTTTGEQVQIMTNETSSTHPVPTNGMWGWRRNPPTDLTGPPIVDDSEVRPTATSVTEVTRTTESTSLGTTRGFTTTTDLQSKVDWPSPESTAPYTITADSQTPTATNIFRKATTPSPEVTNDPLNKPSAKSEPNKPQHSESTYNPVKSTERFTKGVTAVKDTEKKITTAGPTQPSTTGMPKQPIITEDFFPTTPFYTPTMTSRGTAEVTHNLTDTGPTQPHNSLSTKRPYRGRKNKNPFYGHSPLPGLTGISKVITPEMDMTVDKFPSFSNKPRNTPPPKRRKYPPRRKSNVPGRKKHLRPKPEQHERVSKIDNRFTTNVTGISRNDTSKNLSMWHGYHQIPGLNPHLKGRGKAQSVGPRQESTVEPRLKASQANTPKSILNQDDRYRKNRVTTTTSEIIEHSYYDQKFSKSFQSVSAMRRIPTTDSRFVEARPMTKPPEEKTPGITSKEAQSHLPHLYPGTNPAREEVNRTPPSSPASTTDSSHVSQKVHYDKQNPFQPKAPARKHLYVTSKPKHSQTLSSSSNDHSKPILVATEWPSSVTTPRELPVQHKTTTTVHRKGMSATVVARTRPPKTRPTDDTREISDQKKTKKTILQGTATVPQTTQTAAQMDYTYPDHARTKARVTLDERIDMTDSFHTFNYISSEDDTKTTLDGYDQYFTDRDFPELQAVEQTKFTKKGLDGVFSSAATKSPDVSRKSHSSPDSKSTFGWFRKPTKRIYPLQSVGGGLPLSTSRLNRRKTTARYIPGTTRFPDTGREESPSLKPWYRAKEGDHIYNIMKTVRDLQTSANKEASTQGSPTIPRKTTTVQSENGRRRNRMNKGSRGRDRGNAPKFRERFIPRRTTNVPRNKGPSLRVTTPHYYRTRRPGKPRVHSKDKPSLRPVLQPGVHKKRPTPSRSPITPPPQRSTLAAGVPKETVNIFTTSIFQESTMRPSSGHQVTNRNINRTAVPTYSPSNSISGSPTMPTRKSTGRRLYPKFSRSNIHPKTKVRSEYYSKVTSRMTISLFPTLPKTATERGRGVSSTTAKGTTSERKYTEQREHYSRPFSTTKPSTIRIPQTTTAMRTRGKHNRFYTRKTTTMHKPMEPTVVATKHSTLDVSTKVVNSRNPPNLIIPDLEQPPLKDEKVNRKQSKSTNTESSVDVKAQTKSKSPKSKDRATKEVNINHPTPSDSLHENGDMEMKETVTGWWWTKARNNTAIKTAMYERSRFPSFGSSKWRNLRKYTISTESSIDNLKQKTTDAKDDVSPIKTNESTVPNGGQTGGDILATTTKYTSFDVIGDKNVDTIKNWWNLFAPGTDSSQKHSVPPWTRNTWKRFRPTGLKTIQTTETKVSKGFTSPVKTTKKPITSSMIDKKTSAADSSKDLTRPPWTQNTWKRFQPPRVEGIQTTETSEGFTAATETRHQTDKIIPSSVKDTKTNTEVGTGLKNTFSSVHPTRSLTRRPQLTAENNIELQVLTTFPPWTEHTRTNAWEILTKSKIRTSTISKSTSTVTSPTRKTLTNDLRHRANRPSKPGRKSFKPTAGSKITSPPWARSTWERMKTKPRLRTPGTRAPRRKGADHVTIRPTTSTSPTVPESSTINSPTRKHLQSIRSRGQHRETTTYHSPISHMSTTNGALDNLKLDQFDEDIFETKSTVQPNEMYDYFETSLFPSSKTTYRDFNSVVGDDQEISSELGIYPAAASNTKPPYEKVSSDGIVRGRDREWYTTTTALQSSADHKSGGFFKDTPTTKQWNDVEWDRKFEDLLYEPEADSFRTTSVNTMVEPTTMSLLNNDRSRSVKVTTSTSDRNDSGVSVNKKFQTSVGASSKRAGNTTEGSVRVSTHVPFTTEVPNSTKLITDSEQPASVTDSGSVLLTTLIMPSEKTSTIPPFMSTKHDMVPNLTSNNVIKLQTSASITTVSNSPTTVAQTSTSVSTSTLPPVTTVLQTTSDPVTSTSLASTTPDAVFPTTVTSTSQDPASTGTTVLQLSSTSAKPDSSSQAENINLTTILSSIFENVATDQPSSVTQSSTTAFPRTSDSGTNNVTTAVNAVANTGPISSVSSTSRTPYSTRDPKSIKVTLPDLISLHNGTTSSVRNGGKPDFVLNANPVKKKRPPIKIAAPAAGGRPTTTAKLTDPPTPPPTPKWREILPDLITLISVKIPVRTTPRAVGRKTISSSKPVSPASPVYQNADHNKRTKSLDFKTVVEKYWPAILGSFIGAVFLTAAILTSVLCKQQRIFLRRSRSRPQLRRSPASEQASSEQPEMTESSSSASLCGDH